MFSGICSPLLRLVTERHVCPWLVALQTPLTFPAAQQRDSAGAQVTRSADGSSVSAFSLVPSSTKLFPTKKKRTNNQVILLIYFIIIISCMTNETLKVKFLYNKHCHLGHSKGTSLFITVHFITTAFSYTLYLLFEVSPIFFIYKHQVQKVPHRELLVYISHCGCKVITSQEKANGNGFTWKYIVRPVTKVSLGIMKLAISYYVQCDQHHNINYSKCL